MTSHTPGPWVVFGRTVRPAYPNQGSTTGYKPLADATGDKRFVSEEQSLANARLMAAAPDLLEALEDVRRRIGNSEHWWIDCPDKGGFDAEMIDAAIAKARGE